MLQNSLFLMASAGLTAGIGFIFWAVVAHLYTPERIGLATSLLSAISLISYLSLFGLNATLIGFPASGKARNSQITLSLTAVSGTGLVLGVGYLGGLGLFGPQLEFIRTPWIAASFIAFCVFAAVNLLTDSVFIGARLPQYNTLVDGVIQSLAKLATPIFLVTLGAVGIVAAAGVGYAVAVAASLLFMYRKIGFRPDFRTRGTRLRESMRYSASSYLSNLLNLFPLLVLPSIVLRALGPEQAAYYYLAVQIATLLNAASHAIGDNLFAEGAYDPAGTSALLRRSAKIMAVVVVPSALIVTAVRAPLLSLFGAQYSAHAQGLLAILALGSVAVAFNTWATCALRITHRMRQLVVSNAIYTVAVIGFAAAFSSRGLIWAGLAWVVGTFVSALVAALCIPRKGARPAAESVEADEAYALGTGARTAAWQGYADASVTEPMFFPWNRPEAIRFPATPRYSSSFGRLGAEFSHPGGMRLRPRTTAANPYRPDPDLQETVLQPRIRIGPEPAGKTGPVKTPAAGPDAGNPGTAKRDAAGRGAGKPAPAKAAAVMTGTVRTGPVKAAPVDAGPAEGPEPIEEQDTVFTPLPPKATAAPVERGRPAADPDEPRDGGARQVGASRRPGF